MSISIIIPVWNVWNYTYACLQSLARYDDGCIEVVVVDNGSTDATYACLQGVGSELFGKRFVRIRLNDNLGFAKACNAGAKVSHGDFLFFLNNDTIVTENWLTPLVEILKHPDIVAVGPLLLYPDGSCQHCGVSFGPLLRTQHLYAHFPGKHPALRTKHPLQAISGAALMVKRNAFFNVGSFNTCYRNGFEDLDLCFCLRKNGGELAIASDSVIIHHESKTIGRHNNERHNAEVFTARWGNKIRPDMHRQVAVDGYSLRLSPRLVSYLVASPSKIEHLNAQANITLEKTAYLLEMEPLWLDGYLKMAKELEKRKQYERAFNIAIQAMRFFPLDIVHRVAARNAKCLGNKEMEKAVHLLLIANKYTKDNYTKALSFRNRALNYWEDTLLAEIFNHWLSEYRHQ